MDIRFADELGYTIKLLAEAWTSETLKAPIRHSTVALHVAPVLLRHTDLLAQVRGAYNAIAVVGDAVGETLYQGPGAGQMPTASAVVADLIDLAVGRAQRTFAGGKAVGRRRARGSLVEPAERVRSRFYLRLLVADQAGRAGGHHPHPGGRAASAFRASFSMRRRKAPANRCRW